MLEFACFSLEGELKGKRWTWTMQDFHCTPMRGQLTPSSSPYSYCLLLLFEDFGEAMGFKDPVLVLDAKGGEN